MALHTHQTVNGETTAFKCYRSYRGNGRGTSYPCVYFEIYEGHTKPGYAGLEKDARRTTTLRLTKEVLLDLAHYFSELAEAGEPDESPQNASLKQWIRDGMPGGK